MFWSNQGTGRLFPVAAYYSPIWNNKSGPPLIISPPLLLLLLFPACLGKKCLTLTAKGSEENSEMLSEDDFVVTADASRTAKAVAAFFPSDLP